MKRAACFSYITPPIYHCVMLSIPALQIRQVLQTLILLVYQALFWSAYRWISARFPRILDPSEISTNLLRKWTNLEGWPEYPISNIKFSSLDCSCFQTCIFSMR